MGKFEKRIYIAALVVLAAVSFFRFYAIEADPDTTLTWSRLFYSDEQGNSAAAVRKYMSGNWICDPFRSMGLMPVMPWIQYFFFRVMGLSLAASRLPALLLSMAALVIACLLVYERYKHSGTAWIRAVVIVLFLLGTNHYYMVYARLALLDIPMYAMGLSAMYCFFRAGNARTRLCGNILLGVSGVLLGVCFLTKNSGVLFVIAIMLSGMLHAACNGKPYAGARPRPADPLWRPAVAAGIGIAVASLVLVQMNRSGYDVVSMEWRIAAKWFGFRVPDMLRNFLHLADNSFLRTNLALVALSAIGLAATLYRAKKDKHIHDIDALCAALYITHIVFHGLSINQESRYFVALIIPIAYFAAALPFYAVKSSGRRAAVLCAAAIVLANAGNIAAMAHYFGNVRYSLRDLGARLRSDIADDTGGSGSPIVAGPYAPMLALLRVNKEDIVCDVCAVDAGPAVPVYMLEAADGRIPGRSGADFRYVRSYTVLNGYENVVLRLYGVNRE